MPELLYDQKFWLNAFFAAEWALRLAMIVIVPFRRSPDAAKGWLLLIFFEPVAGLILYLLIGRPTLPVWRLVRHADFEALAKPTYDRLAKDANIFHPDVSPELQHAVTLARQCEASITLLHIIDLNLQTKPTSPVNGDLLKVETIEFQP